MTTATLRLSTPMTGTASAPRKGFWARFYAALLEARMQQAMRELRLHRHLMPDDLLKQAGYAATPDEGDLLKR